MPGTGRTNWPVDTGTGDTVTVVGADPLAPDKMRMLESTLVAALERSEVTGARTLEGTVSGTTPPLVTGVAGVFSETVESPGGMGIASGITLVSIDALELGTVSVGELPVPIGTLETETAGPVLTEIAVADDTEVTEAGVTVDSVELATPMSEVTPDTTGARGMDTTVTSSDVVKVDTAADEPVEAATAGIDIV
ncbi:MAG: hypothetical protein FRX48_01417 [Lasallia pustulata]|uniref:Uncharacterized protein n=1 Tax=Lasallia pustulata TaxID=136370 RepID=A0A5M8PYY3_9LECA|nr:MAG: hypothetical protein FRX48_01417 [Lasallia pustulata]